MKHRWVWVCTALILGSSWATAAELKIGYVNAARLLDEAPQAEAATKKLKQEFAPREEGIVQKTKALEDLEAQLRRDGATMTESDRRKVDRDIVEQKRELRRLQDEFRDDLGFRRNEEVGKLQRVVKEIIESLGREEKYDLILYEGIAYASRSLDLTDGILTRLKTLAAEGGKVGASNPGSTVKPASEKSPVNKVIRPLNEGGGAGILNDSSSSKPSGAN